MPAVGLVDGIGIVVEPFEGVYIGRETNELVGQSAKVNVSEIRAKGVHGEWGRSHGTMETVVAEEGASEDLRW